MKNVVRKTFPPKVKKIPTVSIKKKRLIARQEQLKREVQNKGK